MSPPPKIVRRLLLGPTIFVVVLSVLVSLPLWIVIAAFASRFVPGRWRILRVAWFLFVYLLVEVVGLTALFALWIASGFGWKLRSSRFVEWHYALMAWFLRRVMGTARRTFHLSFDVDEASTSDPDRPLLVFSRHAGPGDSFLLIDGLINGADRRPRIVLKETLQWDPCVDVMLNRLPNRFVPARGAGQAAIDAISDLTRTMTADDAFVIFPEGGNFTPKRRARAIEKLGEIGRDDLAERARDLEYLLPPKPAGALAAIDAAPDADVAFFGHVGLEQLSTLRDIWRGLPMDAAVITTVWIVPAEEVPGVDDRERWLYDQWERLDNWIDGVRSDQD